ncbi:MAG TPA: precorrin-3B C(17)-methyltransferase [Candidatus Manganitrophaceae bacterium]|nr:precorrin-3B C(17)-methyltransferase [Candidatus Manganitrophaceae bacterium]
MCDMEDEQTTEETKRGKLLLVGFGPGNQEHLTVRAKEAIAEAEVVIGYKTYIDLVSGLLDGKQVIYTGMTEEIDRAQAAIDMAYAGKKVALISSGDVGIYGMAGLAFELLAGMKWNPEADIEVEVVPGVTALSSCASILGAPVTHDFAAVSLSDLLTPWSLILQRLEAVASADFVIALYNPKSGRRTQQIVEAQKILLKHKSPDTPVGIVKSGLREGQKVVLTTLEKMLDFEIGMLTTILVGNAMTKTYRDKMITPRGYRKKYEERIEAIEEGRFVQKEKVARQVGEG